MWLKRVGFALLVLVLLYAVLVVGGLAVRDQMAAEYATCGSRC